MEETVSSSFAL